MTVRKSDSEHKYDVIITQLNDIQLALISLQSKVNALLQCNPPAINEYTYGGRVTFPIYSPTVEK